MTRFGTLGNFDFNHFNLVVRGFLLEQFGIKLSVLVSAAEIAGTYLPNKVTTVFSMVGRYAAFTSVVKKTAHTGATIKSQYGIPTQRPEAHC